MESAIIIRERLRKVLAEKKLNAHSLGNGNVANWQKIHYQINKGGTLSVEVILIILNAIPDLNTEWLFRGIGSPFKDMTSAEERLNQLEERLAALEGERETDTHTAQQHIA